MSRVMPGAFVNFALAAVLTAAAGLASGASAQSPARPQGPSRPEPRRGAATRVGQAPLETEADAAADVSITARVTADSLRFERVPNPRVEFTGRPRRETAWESERESLPQEVRPGENYRNIGAGAARFARRRPGPFPKVLCRAAHTLPAQEADSPGRPHVRT